MPVAVGRDESFDSLARHDTTTLQRAVMSPVQMPRPQQQQLTTLQRQASDAAVTRCVQSFISSSEDDAAARSFFMVALCNRADHIYFHAVSFFFLFLFPRLISAVGDSMSTIFSHMVWP